MRPNLDSETGPKPDSLPPDAKLEAGYVRYIRILPTQGPNEELCFETCIRRSPSPRGFYYSAISYSWDDPTPSHSIIVDGQERIVAKNLWNFLDHADMQHTRWSEGWLWIDALCIDQSDARERTHQVGIMSEIFGRAGQVISWLGPAYDNSQHTMATNAGYTFSGHTNKHAILSQTDIFEAICSLCERQYWQRLWVFQELRHAKIIVLMCGKVTISWTEFTLLWRAVVDIAPTDEAHSETSDRLNQSLATLMMKLRSKPMDFSLWNLLKETRNLECANQQDRVYSLLSVATKGHEGIEADYAIDPLQLAHRALQNEYAMRRPKTLHDVLMDCEFLDGVFRMIPGTVLRYRRHDAGGQNDSEVRHSWSWTEMSRMERYQNRYRGMTPLVALSRWNAEWGAATSSYVDVESSRVDSLWSVWAEFHGHTAVTRLLQDSQ